MSFLAVELPDYLSFSLTDERIGQLVSTAVVLAVGLPSAALISRLVQRVSTARFSAQAGVLLTRIVRWALIVLVLATALNQFGINLGAVLGAAGIAGIAVGFAAQTSLSNLISGFFLLGEQPFVVGDLIEVDGVTGVVDNIGMISATVRTMDNRSVRIPNETLVKSKVTNITRNPIRRYDLNVAAGYQEDIEEVMRVLRGAAENNPLCLDEPAPVVMFVSFGESAINFMLGVWMVKEDYLAVRNSIAGEVQRAFSANGIQMPFPHRVLSADKGMEPIPVRVVAGAATGPTAAAPASEA
jgi:small-conductance mechanosensitive channel